MVRGCESSVMVSLRVSDGSLRDFWGWSVVLQKPSAPKPLSLIQFKRLIPLREPALKISGLPGGSWDLVTRLYMNEMTMLLITYSPQSRYL